MQNTAKSPDSVCNWNSSYESKQEQNTLII